MGILIFDLKYMYISLLLKIINGFSWPAKIMASPFNFLFLKILAQKNWNFGQKVFFFFFFFFLIFWSKFSDLTDRCVARGWFKLEIPVVWVPFSTKTLICIYNECTPRVRNAARIWESILAEILVIRSAWIKMDSCKYSDCLTKIWRESMNSSKFLLGESKWILALGCKFLTLHWAWV